MSENRILRREPPLTEEKLKLLVELENGIEFCSRGLRSDIIKPAWTKEMENMKKSYIEQYVSEVHKNRIYQQERTRRGGQKQILWATCLEGGKMVTSSTREGLLEKLYLSYSGKVPLAPKYRSTLLGDLFPHFMEWKSMERVTGKTLQEYKRLWKKFYESDEISKADVKRLTHKDWHNFLKRITSTYSLTEKKLKQARIVASEMMTFCVEEDLIPFNPLGKTDYKRLPTVGEDAYNNIKATPFTEDEANAVIQWAFEEMKKPNVRPIYSLAIVFNCWMGLRFAELCGLRWKDVDWKAKTIYISGQATLQYRRTSDGDFVNQGRQRVEHMKSHEKARLLPLPAEALRMLEKIRDLNLSNEYIFPNGSFRYHTYNNKIKRAATSIGLDGKEFRTHCLRATAATNTYNVCLDIKQVQAFLGHANPEMTSKYIKDWRGIDVLRSTMDKIPLSTVQMG